MTNVAAAFALLAVLAVLASSCAATTCPLGAVDDGSGCRCPAGEAPIRDASGEGVCVSTRYRDFVLCMGGVGLKEEAIDRAKRSKAGANVGVPGAVSGGVEGEHEAVESIRRTHTGEEGGVKACVDAFQATVEPAGTALPATSTAQPAAATSAPPSTATASSPEPTAPQAPPSAAATATPATTSPPTAAGSAPAATAKPASPGQPSSCRLDGCGLVGALGKGCSVQCTPEQGIATCDCAPAGVAATPQARCRCVK